MLQVNSIPILYRCQTADLSTIPNAAGIYIIPNVINGHFYVGSSNNLRKRFGNHVWALDHNAHSNPKLQAAWLEFGPSAFEFWVIELTSSTLAREQHWLDAFNVTNRNDCYNLCGVAGSHKGMRRNQATRERLSKAQTGKHHSEQTRQRISTAKRGQRLPERSDAHSRQFRRLSDEQVKQLFALRADGLSVAKVAKMAGVSFTTVRKILSGKTYKGAFYE